MRRVGLRARERQDEVVELARVDRERGRVGREPAALLAACTVTDPAALRVTVTT